MPLQCSESLTNHRIPGFPDNLYDFNTESIRNSKEMINEPQTVLSYYNYNAGMDEYCNHRYDQIIKFVNLKSLKSVLIE